MLITACMIIKNEEEMLKKNLKVLASCVDEIIIVDTGSTDASVGIARQYNAKVLHFPWCNDFSAARNESIKHAKGDWILWIDADERIKPDEFVKLREFLSNAPNLSYNIRIFECAPNSFEGFSSYSRVKLFHNRRGMHFSRPINEQVVDKEGKIVTGQLISCASIYHWGAFRGEDIMLQKRERNINMLKDVLGKNPEDKHYLFLLANNYRYSARYEEAVVEYKKAIEFDQPNQFSSSAYVSLGWCYYNLKRPKEAYQSALSALSLNSDEVAAYNILGAIASGCNHPKEAIELLKKADAIKTSDDPNKAFSIISTRYLANYFSGEAFLKLGQNDRALESFKKAYELDQTEEVKHQLAKMGELEWV
ncbi:MAG: glycosyltransferase [Candidatus Saganbacteria bacterium]|nr:glycosyltransferase [Candidatus Saganbacteria bacterium]